MVIERYPDLERITSTMTEVKENGLYPGPNFTHWEIAKPLAAPGWNWKSRLRGAWLLLCGNAFAVRWY